MNDPYQHRKATATLRFLRGDGTPVAHSAIQVRQKQHHFLFGCGAFDTVALCNGTLGEDAQTAMQTRLDRWLELFNFGTLPFYWGRYEKTPGKTQANDIMAAAQWLRERGVAVKGHPLCWHTVCADWLLTLSNEDILQTQISRIQREVSHFAGVIDMWDVINEVVIMPVFDKYDNAITRVCKELGRVELIKRVFAAARETNPSSTLLLNDFSTGIDYEILLDGCLQAGVPIDAVGIQSHQHQGYWGLEKLHEVLDRFSFFKKPIHFTENTLISGDLMPKHIVDLNDWQVDSWPSTPEGEARQAEELTEMYKVLFAHPLVEAVTHWDHTDGKWLGAPSGILRGDSSKKPVHEALHKLIKRDWWTDTVLCTDENGEAAFTGFKGAYAVHCEGRSFEMKLTENQAEAVTFSL